LTTLEKTNMNLTL